MHGLSKDVPIGSERIRLRLMGEAFNLTNRANFNGIQTTLYTFTEGSSGPRTNYHASSNEFDPRVMQLAVKLIF